MSRYVLPFSHIGKTDAAAVGGKGANLGELSRIPAVVVPDGFCVTTQAYLEFINSSQSFEALLHMLDHVNIELLDELKPAGQRIREHLETMAIPSHIQQEIIGAWEQAGTQHSYAVRSSATAEDLPEASFAGQQDTYLNIIGKENILTHVRKCWASLFTDRAIAYRRRNGFGNDKVLLSVVIQRMISPDVSGILFTADPINGNRHITSIDASLGLGEALVSGVVSADLYQEKHGTIIQKRIAQKEIGIFPQASGGTRTVRLSEAEQTAPALSDQEVLQLAQLGRNIEAHFEIPQDIEWCIAENQIYILQSRPITTLYPVPQIDDDNLHLFLSIGHQQMMTDAMKPLGISVLRTFVPLGKKLPLNESRFVQAAGGRLFADATPLLQSPQIRKHLPAILSIVDELIGRAVREFIDRKEFRTVLASGQSIDISFITKALPTLFISAANILYRDHTDAFPTINHFIANTVKEHRKKIQAAARTNKIAVIQEMLGNLFPMIFKYIAQYMGPALITFKLIERYSFRWLGDTREMGDISKSPPGNVTSEMGLALGDVADVVRNYPAVIEYMRSASDKTFIAGLQSVPGGESVRTALTAFLEKYGMRATGEIDVTRPRWREAPTQLVPAILNHIKGMEPGQHRRDFDAGNQKAAQAAERLINRLRQTPGGFWKAIWMRRLIQVHRSLIGIREHPKYFIVQHLDLIKQAVLEEGVQLMERGVLQTAEDVFWLSLPEIKEVIATGQLDSALIASRKEQFRSYEKLTPPRAITSEGEIITVRPAAAPPGALAGSPVSAGFVTGRARVILKLDEANMEKGDILVAPYTDPGWTPLFPLAAGLVTEIGGLMTHGAVVAREYGIPAVVGVDNATKIIKDGQKIRIDGTLGFVEIMDK